LAAGVVKLLLDGQQRMTSLYGVVRGKPPKFFDGNLQMFTGLRFHLDAEVFRVLPARQDEGRSALDRRYRAHAKGNGGPGRVFSLASQRSRHSQPKSATMSSGSAACSELSRVDLYVEEVTGADKSLDVVVDIFNRVNSDGTKLSKGGLALAKIYADWPEGRDTVKLG
jgi:hypothetical protein